MSTEKLTQNDVDDAVKLALRDLLYSAATPQQIDDAALANALAVAEHIAGACAVRRIGFSCSRSSLQSCQGCGRMN